MTDGGVDNSWEEGEFAKQRWPREGCEVAWTGLFLLPSAVVDPLLGSARGSYFWPVILEGQWLGKKEGSKGKFEPGK